MPPSSAPSSGELLELLAHAYGLAGELTPLPGEEACNAALRTRAGDFVLKVLPSSHAPDLADLQAAAFEHAAAADPELPVPALVRTRGGERWARLRTADGDRAALVTSFLPGRAFADVSPVRDDLLHATGRTLARLDRALADFAHPASSRTLRWDLLQAAWIGDELTAVEDAARRRLVERVHERFVREWGPRLHRVRRQVVHGDANDQNVLVTTSADGSARVSGLIDFGDLCSTALVADAAIAATYASLRADEPVLAIAQVIAGFDEVTPLDDDELALVLPCVLTRLAVSVTTAAVRRRDGTADDYALVNETEAWAVLEHLLHGWERAQHAAIRSGCGREPSPDAARIRAAVAAASAPFAPVLGEAMRTARTAVVDLSFSSLVGGDDPEAFDPATAGVRIDDELRRHGASIGLGRYGEPRTIYTGPAFAGPTPHHERRTVHLGIDLFAPSGTAVQAPLDGEVVLAADCAERLDYGGLVVLRHELPDGTAFGTLYGHLDPSTLERLRPGARVERGEIFAALGDRPENGDWPPHLHFQWLAYDPRGDAAVPPGVSTHAMFGAHAAVHPDPSPLLDLEDEATFVEPDLAAMRARRARHFAPNLLLSYRSPVALVRGVRHWLFDPQGRRHVDGYNNVPHVGHANERVARAVAEQTRLLATNTRYLNDLQLDYAERLTALLPPPLRVCYFVASGSEAIEIALRLVRAHTRRREMLVMEHGYHGATTGAVDVSPYKWGKGRVAKPDWAHASVQPDVYRGRHSGPGAAAAFAHEVERQIDDLRERGRELAGYLCECLPSVGGQIVLPEGFLARVYAAVRAAGGLCIADDVQTALGRTGRYGFGFEQQGVVPDVLVLGKPLGNGFPLAAVVTTEAVRDSFADGPEFFSTFGGSTVACAAGLAVLDELADGRLQRNAQRQGDRMLEALRRLQREHEAIGDVRGSGLFLGVEFVHDREARTPAPDVARYVKERLRERRVLVGTDGPHDNVLKIRPPMTFDDEAREIVVSELSTVLSEPLARAQS